MTSTIFSPYVDHVMEESKTAYLNGLPGATPDTDNGGVSKTVGVRVSRALNDLLPYSLRPIKARRRRARVGYGWRMELHTFRMTWRSHRRPALLKKLQLLKELVWKR
jgi:hypothetical protein